MRILFLTPRFPYPPIKGDSLRAFHQICHLSKEHRITLLSLSEGPVDSAARAEMRGVCERVEVVPLPMWRSALNMGVGLAGREPLQVRFYASAEFRRKLDALLSHDNFDVIHAALIRMLPYVWQRGQPPVVVDLIDSLALNLSARAAAGGPKSWPYKLERNRVVRYERAAAERFPALVVSSQADKEAVGGQANVRVAPNGVDREKFAFRGAEGRDERTVIFTGNMGYAPNREAVLWFVGEVWPLLREMRPGVRFQVVGTNPAAQIRALADEGRGIEVLGRVPDVAEYLGRAVVAVCPMMSGSGIQNKALEAMSVGTPVVATPIANRGVGATDGVELLVAEGAASFAEAVSRLLGNRELREEIARAGRALIEREFRWESHAAQLSDLYRGVTLGAEYVTV